MAKGDTLLDLEQVLYVLQRKNSITQEWVTQSKHVYRGKTDAFIALQRIRENPERDGEEWRAMQKQEAERYREGWNDCAEYIERVHGIMVHDEESNSSLVVSNHRSASGGPRRRVPSTPGRER